MAHPPRPAAAPHSAAHPLCSTPLSVIRDGVTTAWPICLGYLPVGLAFGVLAQKVGFTWLDIGLMSLLVFAGSAQFVAVSMLGTGAALMGIIAATFMINLRHVLMSSALAVHLRGLKRWRLALFAYGITDETFAVNLSKFRQDRWDSLRGLAVNHVSNIAWVASTLVGGYAGQFIPEGAFGIDYALPAMFLALITFQLRGRLYAMTALTAGVLAVAVSVLAPGNAHVIIASAAAATLGVALKRTQLRRMKRKGLS